MKKLNNYFLMGALIVGGVFTSCTKEDTTTNTSSASIEGIWDIYENHAILKDSLTGTQTLYDTTETYAQGDFYINITNGMAITHEMVDGTEEIDTSYVRDLIATEGKIQLSEDNTFTEYEELMVNFSDDNNKVELTQSGYYPFPIDPLNGTFLTVRFDVTLKGNRR